MTDKTTRGQPQRKPAARLPEPEDFWLELGPRPPTTAPTPMKPPGGKGTHPPTPSAWAGPAPNPAGKTDKTRPAEI